ncbi:MAG: hypothetical protein WC518_04165 [Patescibacteria group bacterium]
MISLMKFKELLGEEAIGLTDKEIDEIRQAQHQFALLAFEEWAQKKGLIKKASQIPKNIL